MTNNVEHLFTSLFALMYIFLCEVSVQIFGPFFFFWPIFKLRVFKKNYWVLGVHYIFCILENIHLGLWPIWVNYWTWCKIWIGSVFTVLSSILFCIWISTSLKHHLLKRSSFLHWIVLALLSKINWRSTHVDLFPDSLFCIMDIWDNHFGNPHTTLIILSWTLVVYIHWPFSFKNDFWLF